MKNDSLRLGDVGSDVVTLQQRLHRAGCVLASDGHFGPATDAALRAFQNDRGLLVDGIAGPRTVAALLGYADPKHLSEADVEMAAHELGCDAAAVHAIIEVEAPKGGFLPDGRVVILFERHVFYRQLEAAGLDAAAIAGKQPSLCNTKPGGYLGGAAEYGRLALAKYINPDCAFESASWGRMQVMGFHWQALGYANVHTFVDDMASGETAQLLAGVRLILADEAMHKALIAHDWAAFAKCYNGPAYADHGYDLKLAAAYRRYPPDTSSAQVGAAASAPTDAQPAGTDVAGTSRRGSRKRKLLVPEPPPPVDPATLA